MSTKVKGDKIKEGSIPLSALSDSIRKEFEGKFGYFGFLAEFTTDNQIETRYHGGYLYIITKDGVEYEMRPWENSVTLTDGPNVTISRGEFIYDTNGIAQKMTLTASGNFEWYHLTIYCNKKELPTTIVDWNAQEGEPEYIKNKPFRFVDAYGTDYKFTNPLNREDFEALPPNEWGEVLKYRKPIDADSIQYVVCNKDLSSNGYIYNTILRPINPNNGRYKIHLSEYSGYVYIEEGDWDKGDSNNWLIVEMDYPDAFFPENSVFVIDSNEDVVEYVTASVNINIPNTVVKTTPQSLSDSNKNQALTNLGIDPVVWKYMCEPFKLEHNVKIPQELHNIIWDDELSQFKPISYKLFITHHGIIDYIGSNCLEVRSVSLQYEYNAADHTFVEIV